MGDGMMLELKVIAVFLVLVAIAMLYAIGNTSAGAAAEIVHEPSTNGIRTRHHPAPDRASATRLVPRNLEHTDGEVW